MNFILIEDHNLVRQGVSKIIEEKSSFHCAGTFASIDETKVFLEKYPVRIRIISLLSVSLI